MPNVESLIVQDAGQLKNFAKAANDPNSRLRQARKKMEMLDKLTYKFFAGLDNVSLKIDSICYAGYKIIRNLFNKKRKGRKRKKSV